MKKRSALIQDIWMEIRRSRGRFLSILCIVMLGAGFFAGRRLSNILKINL